MGYHILIINKTQKHHVDLGKYCHPNFQMPEEVLTKYLFEHQGDDLVIANDGGAYDTEDEYPEVDSWHKHLSPPYPVYNQPKLDGM